MSSGTVWRRTGLELGGIDVVRLDFTQADPGPLTLSAGSQCMWVQEGTFYYVGCLSDRAPTDRWLSVAESIEFQPAEE